MNRKLSKMKSYRVTIPYIYEFYVEAKNEDDAVDIAHGQSGNCICVDDDGIEVEEVYNQED